MVWFGVTPSTFLLFLFFAFLLWKFPSETHSTYTKNLNNETMLWTLEE